MIKYSVVIPTINNCQELSNCLKSIMMWSPLDETEVIVVVNGPDPLTEQFLDTAKNSTSLNVKIIVNQKNEGFCVATNQGMEAATGEYIVWLNDDTVVTPGWLEKLRASIEVPHPYHTKLGLTGPVSNNVGGRQLCHQFRDIGPNNAAEASNKLWAAYCEQVGSPMTDNRSALAGFLSGFCLMLKREVYETIGGIDERFSPGGFCDNDFMVRAIKAGYGATIASHTLIYHKGSSTLNKLFPEQGRGLANWPKYVNKYADTKEKKLLLVQRIKIDDDKQLDIFKKCAAENAKLVDGVHILSDKSKHKDFTHKMLKEIFGDIPVTLETNPKTFPFNEFRDRRRLVEVASKSGFDWAVALDHDEHIGGIDTRNRLKQLMNPFNPAIMSYGFICNNYWRSTTMVRIDPPWGQGAFLRMWKIGPFPNVLRVSESNEDTGLHCGGKPLSIPEDMMAICDLTVEHFGYVHQEHAESKQKFYQETDKTTGETRKILVGTPNYEHLTDESNMQMVAPKPFTVSLNVMMKNEEFDIGRTLLTYAPIVREYVLCDTGSTDRTKEYLAEVGVPFFEMPFNDNFAEIRNEIIKRSTMDYCLHVDPDEIPETKALEKITYMLNRGPDVCLTHLETSKKDGRSVTIRQPRIFKNDGRFYYYGRVHETLDKALEDVPYLKSQDVGLKSFNPGFLKSDEAIQQKLEFYGRLLEKEIEDHPDNFKAIFELALHKRTYGDLDEALELLEKALSLRPDYTKARLEMAMIRAYQATRILEAASQCKADQDTKHAVESLYADLHKYTQHLHIEGVQ